MILLLGQVKNAIAFNTNIAQPHRCEPVVSDSVRRNERRGNKFYIESGDRIFGRVGSNAEAFHMADTDAVSVSSGTDDTGDATGAAQIGASNVQSEIAWTVGDTLPHDHPTSVDVAEMHEVLTESSGSMDLALHQLTTATDLFDVPVIDFDGHSS
jgi:hypothetical protein